MRVIEDIATELGCSYIYDDYNRINLLADQVKKFPLIAEVLPSEGTINTKLAPVMQVTKTTMVEFLVECDLDFIGKEVGAKVDAMLELCKRFIMLYNERGDVEPLPDVINYSAVYVHMDRCMCGVSINIPATDNGGCVNG